jgi:hypothetical protein
MRGRGWAVVGGAALVGVMVWSTWPTSESGYRQILTGAAQDALSAAGTTMLAAQADLAGDLVGPYTATTLDENREAVATATQSVLAAAVPNEPSADLRAQLIPLLMAAADSITSVHTAVQDADTAGIRVAAATLQPTMDRLDEFIRDNG